MYLVKHGDLEEREIGIKIGYNIGIQTNQWHIYQTENNQREALSNINILSHGQAKV